MKILGYRCPFTLRAFMFSDLFIATALYYLATFDDT